MVSFTLRVLKNAKENIVQEKNAELMFANFPRIRKLKFQIFQITIIISTLLLRM